MKERTGRIRRLHLENFKGFRDATFEVGDFSVVVGANAAGKSNLREAFRFLHGVARGYTVAEILGEKWIEGGVLQWKGIRGGTRDAIFRGRRSFTITATIEPGDKNAVDYKIEIGALGQSAELVVLKEFVDRPRPRLFRRLSDSHRSDGRTPGLAFDALRHFSKRQPDPIVQTLESIRFLDLSPDAMRIPSLPGQTVLGDRGENLSSVLQAICEEPERKQTVLQWLRQLTPADVIDLEFVSDAAGRVLVVLVEADGRRTSAISASDGTLRFLALLGAFFGVDSARLYFIEEIDTGFHPTRLHLLIQLIESQTELGATQVVATTHSPQLLALLSERSLNTAALAYRLAHTQDQKLIKLVDLPDARRVLREHDLAQLQASGWLEDAAEYLAADAPVTKVAE